MVERIMEVFMDDITIYGNAFDECLVNLEAVLNRCIEKDLVLNWEKCHFMVQQGIVLGHIISKQGIEVFKAKVELIVKLPYSFDICWGWQLDNEFNLCFFNFNAFLEDDVPKDNPLLYHEMALLPVKH